MFTIRRIVCESPVAAKPVWKSFQLYNVLEFCCCCYRSLFLRSYAYTADLNECAYSFILILNFSMLKGASFVR